MDTNDNKEACRRREQQQKQLQYIKYKIKKVTGSSETASSVQSHIR
jgi:hypothetical protein